MKRYVVAAVVAGLAVFGFAGSAWAGSPHFVGTPSYTQSGSTLSVSAKEAGLGDEPQIHVVLTGTASCVNPGGNQPSAANKTTFSQAADEPVQNGKSDYTLEVTAVLQPSCSPPMAVVFSGVVLTDTTNDLAVTVIP